jgi:hypothetical protein
MKIAFMKYPPFVLLAVALVLINVSPQKLDAQTPTPKKAEVDHSGKLIQFEASGCRGYCPMYKLTFRKDGFLVYNGIRNVEVLGPSTIRLSSDEFANLLKEVTQVDLWQYPAELPSTATDAPAHTFTVYDGVKAHAVKGRAAIPPPVKNLEILLKDIAEAHGLPVKTGTNPNYPGYQKEQVIVKFKQDVYVREFCNQFSEIKIRPIQNLSEDNTWTIAFSPAEITKEQMISLLKDMDGVLTVEPGKEVINRN